MGFRSCCAAKKWHQHTEKAKKYRLFLFCDQVLYSAPVVKTPQRSPAMSPGTICMTYPYRAHHAPGLLHVWVKGEFGQHFSDFAAHFGFDGFIPFGAVGGQTIDHFDDPIGDLAELSLPKPARCARG